MSVLRTDTEIEPDGETRGPDKPAHEKTDCAEPQEPGQGPFFRRRDWTAFWVSFLVSLAVYTYTLAPTLSLEDSGELAVAADYLGVPVDGPYKPEHYRY